VVTINVLLDSRLAAHGMAQASLGLTFSMPRAATGRIPECRGAHGCARTTTCTSCASRGNDEE